MHVLIPRDGMRGRPRWYEPLVPSAFVSPPMPAKVRDDPHERPNEWMNATAAGAVKTCRAAHGPADPQWYLGFATRHVC